MSCFLLHLIVKQMQIDKNRQLGLMANLQRYDDLMTVRLNNEGQTYVLSN